MGLLVRPAGQTSWTGQLDRPVGQISWTGQLYGPADSPAGQTSSSYLKPWPVRIFKNFPFSLYIVAACESDEGLVFKNWDNVQEEGGNKFLSQKCPNFNLVPISIWEL